MKKHNFYVVWEGHSTGVFDNWEECKKQIGGFNGALYKSFASKAEAEMAFTDNPYKFIGNKVKVKKEPVRLNPERFIDNSLSVDAACSGNPGLMKYRGVHVLTNEVWFSKEFPLGTNNIGEFLAIVHGLAELKRRNMDIPIYSDSETAIIWIKKGRCATKLPETENTKYLFEVIRRAEKWLAANKKQHKILKWDTVSWGEIPADFGQKNNP